MAGCVNFEAKPDPTRHYTLGPRDALAASMDDARAPVYIQRPDLPAYASGNRFMVRDRSGEVRALGGVRWAEAMSEGLARALGEWIGASSGRRVSGYYPWPALDEEALSVKVQFLQLLAVEEGDVLVAANWRVYDDGRVVAEARYQSESITWQPGQPETLVDGLNLALKQIGAAVAAQL